MRMQGWVCSVLVGWPPCWAHGQAPINSNVALQPATGQTIVRQQIRAFAGDTPGGRRIEQFSSVTTVVYGVDDALTMIVDVPVILSRRVGRADGSSDSDAGVGDARLLSKIRVFRDDWGPTETTRFNLIAGLEASVGGDAFTSDSWDPIVGGVGTHVWGRHALSVDALWKINTGGGRRGEDALLADLAYLYRLMPGSYNDGDTSSLFGSIELNGTFWTDGDAELLLSPGVQYATRRWILEATVQVPLVQEVEFRVERDIAVGLGVRVQF